MKKDLTAIKEKSKEGKFTGGTIVNMQKLMIFILIIFFASATGLFAIFHLGVTAGYSYATMNDMKAGFKNIKDAAAAASRTAKVGDFGTSVYTNVDLDLGSDFMILAARTGLQYVLPMDIEITDPLDPYVNTKVSYSAFLLPVMLGINFNVKIPENPIRLALGVFAGYGIAITTQTYAASGDFTLSPQDAVYDSIYQGGGFMYEGTGSAEFYIFDCLTLGVNLGYRYAKFNGLTAVNKVDIYGCTVVPADQVLTVPANESRSVDFSGFTAGLGLNFRL